MVGGTLPCSHRMKAVELTDWLLSGMRELGHARFNMVSHARRGMECCHEHGSSQPPDGLNQPV